MKIHIIYGIFTFCGLTHGWPTETKVVTQKNYKKATCLSCVKLFKYKKSKNKKLKFFAFQ